MHNIWAWAETGSHTAQAGLEPLLLPLRHCDYRHVLLSTVLGSLSDAPIFEKSVAPHKSP